MTKRQKLVLVIAGLATILIIGFQPRGSWDGGAGVQIRFHIVELRKNSVVDAQIRVIDQSDLEYLVSTNSISSLRMAKTDINGAAVLLVPCGAGGSMTMLFGKTGRINISDRLLLIEAEGYFPISIALENILGGREWPLSKRSFDIDLVMFPKPNE